jgi:hypothetical protein
LRVDCKYAIYILIKNDDNNNNNKIIKFFVYLRAQLNSQWPITESARIQTAATVRQHRSKQTNNNNNEHFLNPHSPNTEIDTLKLEIHVFVMCNAEMCDNK